MLQVEQMRITGHNELGAGGKRASRDCIIIDIPGNHAPDLCGHDEMCKHRVAVHQKFGSCLVRGDHGREMRP